MEAHYRADPTAPNAPGTGAVSVFAYIGRNTLLALQIGSAMECIQAFIISTKVHVTPHIYYIIYIYIYTYVSIHVHI
jgi:hypothetical protein